MTLIPAYVVGLASAITISSSCFNAKDTAPNIIVLEFDCTDMNGTTDADKLVQLKGMETITIGAAKYTLAANLELFTSGTR